MVSLQDEFLKALMERFPNPGMAAVIEALPEELGSKFRLLPQRVGKAPELFFAQPKRVLAGMHPSWCEELVHFSPEALRPLIRMLVLDAVGKNEGKTEISLTVPLRNFLLRYLVDKWPERTIQGVESIEGASFGWLAKSDERTLLSLVELLAVNDVVDVVRQIVDKKTLQKILAVLTPLQQRYLRSLLYRPIRLATPNKELTTFLLDDPTLGAQRLTQRGFEELAIAMKQEPELLQWHVLHHIDRKKASFLKEVMEKKVAPEEVSKVQKHLSHAYQFLKKMETK